ncbi:MAG: NAD-dependent epimerase/dehydratase family protein [Proteobacteria bacterium]|nr:NAD-dependent epimerase/dehydratase family protein [Pseudomonadota bacterium]
MNTNPNSTKTVLVTGANGFIGRQLISDLANQIPGFSIKVISRKSILNLDSVLDFDRFINNDFKPSFFSDVTHVIHLAGVAHRFNNIDSTELERINVGYLQKLMFNLNLNSLEKLIFMSSYSVSLIEQSIVMDTAQYAVTKQNAELLLKDWYQKTSKLFEVIILRPTMVYGRGAPGNFERLQKLLKIPIPLPFGNLDRRRSFIHVRNLSSAMLSLLKAPRQAGIAVWELSDPWSETFIGFIQDLNKAIDGKAIIFKFPICLLRYGLSLLGKADLFRKLTLSFHIDVGPFIKQFNWSNVVSFESRFDDLEGAN